MKKEYIISVITVNLNSGESLKRAIESVLEQDYPHYEHVIVDGLSSDDSLDIIKSYSHLRWVSEKDNGQADAMNKGFRMSQGDIVVYLNADDYFFPGAFSEVIRAFDDGADFVVGNVLIKSARLGAEFINTPRITLEGMLRHWEPNAFCHNPVGYFYKRKVQEICPFNVNNYSTMDLEFLLDASKFFSFQKVEKTLGCFEDSLNTKTQLTQDKYDYWCKSNFLYVEKFIATMSFEEKLSYEQDRLLGYEKCQRHMNQLAKSRRKASNQNCEKKISVIIPTYNCGEYVCRAIDSVLSQSYKNFEIIVVNDASTDDTKNILNKNYASFDNIKIINCTANKGQSTSRNIALKYVSAELIFFLDADDWIESNTFRTLVDILIETDADIVQCGTMLAFADMHFEHYHGSCVVVSDIFSILNAYANYAISSTVWNKLYKSSIIIDNGIYFDDEIVHEDILFVLKILLKCTKIVSIEDEFINYFQRAGSTVNSKPNYKYLFSYIYIHDAIPNILKDFVVDDISEYYAVKVLDAHSTKHFIEKMHEMKTLYTPNELKFFCFNACKTIFGVNGYSVATALYSLLMRYKSLPAQNDGAHCIKNKSSFILVVCKFIYKISPDCVRRILKKMYCLLCNNSVY